jgi:hypothetical protein
MFIVAKAAGTTGEFIFTPTVTSLRGAIGVLPMYGANITPADTDTGTPAGGDFTATLTVPVGGVVVAYSSNIGSFTCTWTNAVEGFDRAIEGTVLHSGAAQEHAAGGDIAVRGLWSGSGADIPYIFAAFGP